MKNVILILSDQHRFCDVGYMGNQAVETPVLDRLASEGACFTNMYSSCPLCVPARGTIFTGLHALKHKAAANDLPVDPAAPSLAKAFHSAGYQTAYIGKWHLGGTPRDKFIDREERLGFDYWRGCNCNHEYLDAYYDDNDNCRHPIDGYEPIAQTDLALEFLKGNNGQPFLLCLSYGPPHDPYFALPEGVLEHFQAKEFPLRPNAVDQKIQDFALRNKNLHDLYAGYYAQISCLDKQIGRIVDWLKESGHAEDTILIYTSDHGDMLGSHGFANKQIWYEESAKVPCLFWAPGLVEPGVRQQLLSLVDLAPTICGLCQVPYGKADGKNISDAVRNPDTKGQDYVYFYSYVPCHQASMRKVKSWRAITDGRYKLIADSKGKIVGFYDCQEDPLEENNLKKESRTAEKRDAMMAVLRREVQKQDGFVPYEELLNQAGLIQPWVESERFFTQLWTFVPKPLRQLKMLLLSRLEKKYRKSERRHAK
ncbi:MAG: sulfatase [Faecousia sp.]